jgi:hypothetical protein
VYSIFTVPKLYCSVNVQRSKQHYVTEHKTMSNLIHHHFYYQDNAAETLTKLAHRRQRPIANPALFQRFFQHFEKRKKAQTNFFMSLSPADFPRCSITFSQRSPSLKIASRKNVVVL